MITKHVYEIVVFKAKAGVTDEQVISALEKIQPFLEDYKGYISRELIKTEGDQWVDQVKWETLDDAHTAANDILSEPEAALIMDVIDPESINMMHGNVVFTTEKVTTTE